MRRKQTPAEGVDRYLEAVYMDEDLNRMTREELIDEVRKLRQAVRRHRGSSRHELCWHQPEMWSLLPEKTDPVPVVPEWHEFIKGCVTYRQSLKWGRSPFSADNPTVQFSDFLGTCPAAGVC